MIVNDRETFNEILNSGHIDFEAMPLDELYQSFEFLNKKMMILYRFVLSYNEYINSRHCYTEEEALTTLEVHLLTDICDYPDSTVTSLANFWNRSVSATSQTIRKLIQKDLVTRENSKDNAKIFYLKPTEKGIRISNAHKGYDMLDIVKTMKRLQHTLSIDEILTMFKGLETYINVLQKNA